MGLLAALALMLLNVGFAVYALGAGGDARSHVQGCLGSQDPLDCAPGNSVRISPMAKNVGKESSGRKRALEKAIVKEGAKQGALQSQLALSRARMRSLRDEYARATAQEAKRKRAVGVRKPPNRCGACLYRQQGRAGCPAHTYASGCDNAQ